jgi:glycolate oxidase
MAGKTDIHSNAYGKKGRDIIEMLKESGIDVSNQDKDLIFFSHDKSYITPVRPMAVAFPENKEQVATILSMCNKNRVKVTAVGGSSSLTGSSIPLKGGIAISMERLNRIIEINVEDGFARVEPNITIEELNRKLERYGYFYPPDPASAHMATIGGSISTNAGGLKALMYGSTKHWILDTELVLASGEIIRTGSSTLKMSRGYDLTALVCGSEGTLGIVTQATLKIAKRPESSGIIISYFSSIKDLAEAVGELKKQGMPLIMAEFMDHASLSEFMHARKRKIPNNANYVLLTSVSSTGKNNVIAKVCVKIIGKHKPAKQEYISKDREIRGIYSARRELHEKMVEEAHMEGRDIIIGDVIVPPSRLAPALLEMEHEIRSSGQRVALFGHIGDGNIHSNVYFTPIDKKGIKKVMKLQERIGRIALKNGGSVSAEHGIGLEKKALLIEELSSKDSERILSIMKEIKKAFDPNGILNPGKIFDI